MILMDIIMIFRKIANRSLLDVNALMPRKLIIKKIYMLVRLIKEN